MPAPSPLRPTDAELRTLYVDQRLSAEAIGRQCEVEKITVLRWLKAAGIERRPMGDHLARRGLARPSADLLHELVHEQHLSYRQIAARFGVDFTCVPYWLRMYGIPSPGIWETRRRGRTASEPVEAELRERIEAGQSLGMVAADFDVSSATLRNRCREYGIPVRLDGWGGGRRLVCSDGHLARSSYELRVDDWLTTHGLLHKVEPHYPWDRRYKADFLVGATYIEVWGVLNDPAYTKRKVMKVARCKAEGVDLIQINCWQFAGKRRWWSVLERLQDVGPDIAEVIG